MAYKYSRTTIKPKKSGPVISLSPIKNTENNAKYRKSTRSQQSLLNKLIMHCKNG